MLVHFFHLIGTWLRTHFLSLNLKSFKFLASLMFSGRLFHWTDALYLNDRLAISPSAVESGPSLMF